MADTTARKVAASSTDTSTRFVLTNRGGHALAVPIVHVATGKKSMVFVQAGGKPKLAPGYRVDPVFAARNPHLGASAISN